MYAIDETSFNKLVEEFKALRTESEKQKSDQMNNRWLTVTETCKILKISRRTFFSWKAKEILPCSQIGAKLYVKQSDIFNLLESHHSSKF